MKLKILFLLAIGLAGLLPEAWGAPAHCDLTPNEPLLHTLDSLIDTQQHLVDLKEERISGLRATFGRTSHGGDKIGVARQLYNEYEVYNSDSAMHYAREGLRLTLLVQPDNAQLKNEWLMYGAQSFLVQGLYSEASRMLDSVDTDALDTAAKGFYLKLRTDQHMMHALYFEEESEAWRDELQKSVQYLEALKDHARTDPSCIWASIVLELNNGTKNFNPDDVKTLKSLVDAQTHHSRANAIQAYWLARYYDATGDYDNMVRYMAVAAIHDASIVNRDMAAVQSLAMHAMDAGQAARAYSYISFAVNQANLNHARHRMIHMSDLNTTIRENYRREIAERDSHLRTLAWALGLIALLLVAALAFIWMELKKLRATRGRLAQTNNALQKSVAEHHLTISNLETANSLLSDANARLNELNSHLHDTNEQKLSVLAYAFKLTSQFADDIESYRKKLLKAHKAKDSTTLGVLINDPELIKEQYKAFYEGFDSMTLSLFPDLAAEYNAEAPEELRVAPEAAAKTKALNTRLRIYALRRLGVSKSADIAAMLNVSIRTVYNNRSTAASPKDD